MPELPTRIAHSVDEAADLLSLSPSEIRRLIRKGLLRRVPHTGRVLIAHRELERFAAGEEQAA
jgi:excisionase family DNA binding protein